MVFQLHPIAECDRIISSRDGVVLREYASLGSPRESVYVLIIQKVPVFEWWERGATYEKGLPRWAAEAIVKML